MAIRIECNRNGSARGRHLGIADWPRQRLTIDLHTQKTMPVQVRWVLNGELDQHLQDDTPPSSHAFRHDGYLVIRDSVAISSSTLYR